MRKNLLSIYLFRKVHPTVSTVFGTTPVPVFIQAHFIGSSFSFFFREHLKTIIEFTEWNRLKFKKYSFI